jgi:hypothetical protein
MPSPIPTEHILGEKAIESLIPKKDEIAIRINTVDLFNLILNVCSLSSPNQLLVNGKIVNRWRRAKSYCRQRQSRTFKETQ